MTRQDNNARRNEVYAEFSARRNPYLMDYETHRKGRGSQRQARGAASGRRRTEPDSARADIVSIIAHGRSPAAPSAVLSGRREYAGYRRAERGRDTTAAPHKNRYIDQREVTRSRDMAALPRERRPVNRSGVAARRNAARRKRVRMQRLIAAVWLLCILALAGALIIRSQRMTAADSGQMKGSFGKNAESEGEPRFSGVMVQGLPAEVFARHPQWEENLLTPNEYSRPGDELTSVTNLFVHYTANPGTSAAQNRSYFEQQKDTHEVSVSSHFIIGYEGEIIQCVPLDEIAYAVMTRNYDSISIECCYLEADGSFTQETYDSLISLLAWLTEAYELDTEDILRHYDCGGKKCPLYYTNHEDEWEQLKKDVDKL